MLLEAIGVIHSPYKEKNEAPFQGCLSQETMTLEIFPQYTDGLKNIELFPQIVVLYWLDRANRNKLQTVTPHGPEVIGVFSTRSPNRPNPIGICVVDVLRVDNGKLEVRGLDALDGTPLLDIKPYAFNSDCFYANTFNTLGKDCKS